MAEEHEQVKQKETTPKASYGYGGKFGVERDRMDKVYKSSCWSLKIWGWVPLCLISVASVQVAVGHSYVAQVEQHSSQKDASRGFGGKFGVQTDRVDKVRTSSDKYRQAGGSVCIISSQLLELIRAT